MKAGVVVVQTKSPKLPQGRLSGATPIGASFLDPLTPLSSTSLAFHKGCAIVTHATWAPN